MAQGARTGEPAVLLLDREEQPQADKAGTYAETNAVGTTWELVSTQRESAGWAWAWAGGWMLDGANRLTDEGCSD